MQILYLTNGGKRINPYSDDKNEYDFDSIKSTIRNGIISKFPDIEIVFGKEILTEDGFIPNEKLGIFDLCLCDLTFFNPNVYYLAGLVEGIGKPIIYFSSNEHGTAQALSHKNILLYSKASIENEFITELNELVEQVKKNPTNFVFQIKESLTKPKAFVSYSHSNKDYLNRLMVHLKPLVKKGLIDVWQDTKIKTGDQWKEEIAKALTEANIAILMISADFMASDFIIDNELPPLLSKAEVKGTKIVPVILSPCRFSREPTLNRFQAVNQPSEPLSLMSEDQREIIYDRLTSDIELALEKP